MTTTGRSLLTRRTVLRSIGAGSLAALAGCTSDGGGGGGDDEEQSSPDPEPVDVSESATWRTEPITDVTADEDVRIETFDRPAIVHTFATKCAVCQSQHGQFEEFYASVGDDVEIVDLTIDPQDDPDTIRSYADEEGLDWRFGTATEEITGSLVSDFGQEVTSSAASPVVVACPDGAVYTLEKVIDADDLESVLEDVC